EAGVDDASAALDVVHGVSREGAPADLRNQETKTCPGVDADASVAQPGDGSVERGRVLACRDRVDDDVGAERAPQMLVAEVDGTLQVLVAVRGGDAGFSEHDGERLGGAAHVGGGGAGE